jgi:anti-sigma factor (TIGR02949 family)
VSKLTCQEVLDQLWEYLDDDARVELTTKINEHIGGCMHCKVEVDSLRRTISLYRCEDRVGTPIQLSERLQAALQMAYREVEPAGD